MTPVTFPKGKLSKYFRAKQSPAVITDLGLRAELLAATRCLIQPFLDNTEFSRGIIDLSILEVVLINTIFNRRSHGNVPYILVDLVRDLRNGVVDRSEIDEETERAIRHFAARSGEIPQSPLPCLIEDCSSQHYLVIEGNRRLTGLALRGPSNQPALEVYVGRTTLTWAEMLQCFEMEDSE